MDNNYVGVYVPNLGNKVGGPKGEVGVGSEGEGIWMGSN